MSFYGIIDRKCIFSEPNITPWTTSNNDIGKKDVQAFDSDSTSCHSSHDGQMINGEFVKHHGMSWIVAALFLVGDM